MPGSPHRARRAAVLRIAALLAASLAAAVVLLGPGAAAARAHDALTGTTPSQDATVDAPPAQVTLEFSRPPQALGTQVLVTGPAGRQATQGTVQLEGTGVTQALVRNLPAGSYTVSWRVTSADGHPLSGTFTFAVAGAASAAGNAPAADPAGSVGGAADAGPAAAPDGVSSPVIWSAVAAIVAAAGVLLVRQRRTRP